jgi:hypothetical protein
MLRFLGDQRLSLSGNGTWVKAIASKNQIDLDNSANKISVVVANYDHRNSVTETFPVTFTQITPGRYRIYQEFLDGRKQEYSVATTGALLKHTLTLPHNSVVRLEFEKTSN